MEFVGWTSRVVAGATLYLLGTECPVDSVRIDGEPVAMLHLAQDPRWASWLERPDEPTNIAVRMPDGLPLGAHTVEVARGQERWTGTVRVIGATLYPRRGEAHCNRVGEPGRHPFVYGGYGYYETRGFLIWPILGRPTVVRAPRLPVLSFPLRAQVILADGTLGRPSLFWRCARHPVEFKPSAPRFQLFNRRGKPRFRDARMPTPPPQGSPSPPPPSPAR